MTPLDLAQFSERAYHQATVTAGNVEVLISWHDDALVIAPRGTEKDGADILTDLRFMPWWDSDIGWCHKGFLRATQAVWPKLREYLRDTTCPVWWTGHSLAGAITILGAAKMQATMRMPAGIVTFGAPRAGFDRVREILAPVPVKTCYVRGMDIVPDWPHAWPWWGPRHLVELTEIGTPDHLFHDHRIAGYIEDVPRA